MIYNRGSIPTPSSPSHKFHFAVHYFPTDFPKHVFFCFFILFCGKINKLKLKLKTINQSFIPLNLSGVIFRLLQSLGRTQCTSIFAPGFAAQYL